MQQPSRTNYIGNNVFTNLDRLHPIHSRPVLPHVLPLPRPLAHVHQLRAILRSAARLHLHATSLRLLQHSRRHLGHKRRQRHQHRSRRMPRSPRTATVEVEMPSEQLDIDSGYDEALRNLRDRVEVPPPPVPESQLQEDYYRGVRTYLVIVWLSCNAVLVMVVSEAYSNTHIADNFYLSCILWSVAGSGALPRDR